MVNIKDVARVAGVSTSTVSNIINNTVNVSSDKLKRVQEAIKELGYKPNTTARSLRTSITKIIAVILPNIEDPNFAFLFTGIERVLSEKGYTAVLYTTSEIPAKESNIIEQISQNRVAGAIIITCDPKNVEAFNQLDQSGIKLVFVERELFGKDYNFVEYNNYASIYDITSKLINNDFKNILLITGPKEYTSERQCINGFNDAIINIGKSLVNTQIKETNFDKESSFKVAVKELRYKNIPQAILVTSSLIYEGVLEAINILSKHLEKKPLIITLTEHSWSHSIKNIPYDCPPVITIQRRPIELGEIVAEKLIENIENPLIYENINIRIDNVFPDKDSIKGGTKKYIKSEKSTDIKLLMLEGSASEALKTLIPDFELQNGVSVSIEILDIRKLYEKIYIESKNDKYDIFQIDIPWFPELVEGNYLSDLDEYVSSNPNTIDGFIPGVLDNYAKYKGKYFALPYLFGVQLLFYRKDLFENYVLKKQFKKIFQSELLPPKTWKEFNIIAKFFTKSFNPDSPVEYGTTLGARFPNGALCEFLPRMWSYGGNIMNLQGNIFLEERAAIKALKNYVESFSYSSPGSVDNYWEEEVREFCNGNSAMMILFVAHVTEITDRSLSKVVGKIGYSIIPGGIPVLGGWSLGINNRSRKKDISFEFIKWATSKELAIPFTILGGYTPRLDLFKSSDLLTIYPWLPKALESFSLSRERSISRVTIGGKISERDFENIYGEAIVKAVKKELTPEIAIKNAQDKIKRLLSINNK